MRILGIDPGYAILGWGVIDMKGNSFHVAGYGSIETDAGTPMADRLKTIYSSLMDVIYDFQPDAAAIEELFFNNNAKTAILVGQARGVAVLACILNSISFPKNQLR